MTEESTMLPKPSSINGVGIVQFLLAAVFVIWLVFFPDTATQFAWPIPHRLAAMFIGTGFILRSFLGWRLWREKYWYRLRWIVWGNYAFLGVLFLATYWHLNEMNWKSNIYIAHIWVLAYTIEPLMLVLIEPHGAESRAPLPAEVAEGPVSIWMKRLLGVIFIMGVTGAGFLFINPTFAATRWPWTFDPFNARVMAAWPAACAVWAATMYFGRDWAEIKLGVQTLVIYTAALFGVWLFTYPQYRPISTGLSYGIICGLTAASLVFLYWRQEVARPAVRMSQGKSV